jgi:hypothetical protein
MDMNAKDLLLRDLDYVRDSFWKNEEIGEKRFSFFVTLVTAVVGALVALEKSPGTDVSDVVPWALSVLLVFGLLTYARMLHRNAVSDNYKKLSGYISNKYFALCNDLEDISYKLDWKPDTGRLKWPRAGYADVVGVINGVFCGALISHFTSCVAIPVVSGIALAVLSWIPSFLRSDVE